MSSSQSNARVNKEKVGAEIYELIKGLFPICRSITGNGVRQTLKIVGEYVPLEIHEVPTGTRVFDWTVPEEWNIEDAYVKNAKGEKVIDFQQSNLHVLNYSVPIKKKMALDELKQHLFTLPDHPDWIPYKTSYYKENWGFCLSHKQFLSLQEGEYEVVIDSSLAGGHLTYGECVIPGESKDEVLISAHVCHPSLANDNLSGVCTAAFLAKSVMDNKPRYSYRFLLIPGTIGAITWLWLNESSANRIKHGLVITGVGDSGKITYKKSRRGDAEIDHAVAHVLKHCGNDYEIRGFSPYGYDERQYCSPGFNLPVGRLSRTPFTEYPEYHTSADNLEFVHPEYLGDSFLRVLEILNLLEKNRTFLNLSPKCEPQLGKRGLYSSIGANELAMLWVLNLSDGDHSLLDISDRSGLEFSLLYDVSKILKEKGLLKEQLPVG